MCAVNSAINNLLFYTEIVCNLKNDHNIDNNTTRKENKKVLPQMVQYVFL